MEYREYERLRVLAFDDNAIIRSFLSDALEALAHEACVLESGGAALEFLDSADGRGWPTAIVMDVSIPGEDGLRTLEAIRERLPEVPVLIMSGYEHAEELLEAGATTFLPKPFRIKVLAEALLEATR